MSARPALPPLDPAAFRDLKALIVAETGHHYYEDKDDQLAERVRRRMAELHIADAALYLERLRDEAAGPREWRLLESELTIKETFFFRFAEQFAALRGHLLPALIKAHAEDRRLRIWSAGCSTGAEPYSLAVVIHDLLGEAVADWHVSILGTDIDEGALAVAREARYGGWALRATPPAERERLFDHDGTRWRLKAAYRGMVRFERHNLLDLLGPTAALGRDGYDLILCRNLLIYFRPDLASRLIGALGGRLAETGWLLLGHAEAGVAIDSGLVPANHSGIVAYRRPSAPEEAFPAPDAVARRRPPRSPSLRRREVRPPVTLPKAAPPLAPLVAGDWAEIRGLLARGETGKARALAAAARAEKRADARLLYLEALAATAEEDRAAAEQALRGALYLDRDFAMAHYLLARVAQGRPVVARRALANAAAALAAADPAASVAEGEGLTVADLRETIRHALAEKGAA